METIYTLKEAASVLNISKTQIYRLVNRQDLECFRVGRAVRVPESALKVYIQNHGNVGKNEV